MGLAIEVISDTLPIQGQNAKTAQGGLFISSLYDGWTYNLTDVESSAKQILRGAPEC